MSFVHKSKIFLQKKIVCLPYKILGTSVIIALSIAIFWLSFSDPSVQINVKMSAPGAEIVRAYWQDPQTNSNAYEPLIVNPFELENFNIKIEPLADKNSAADAYKVGVLQIQTPQDSIDWSKVNFAGEQWKFFNYPIAMSGKMAMAYSEDKENPEIYIPYGQKESISAQLKGTDLSISFVTGRDQGKVRVIVNKKVREVDLFNKRQGVYRLNFSATPKGDTTIRDYSFPMPISTWKKLQFVTDEGELNILEVKVGETISESIQRDIFLVPKNIFYRSAIKQIFIFTIVFCSVFLFTFGLAIFLTTRYARSTQILLLLSWICLGFWWVVKSALFEKLAYSHDLLFFIQTASSIFKNRSILYHNYFGNYAGIHNNYLTLFFYPLTSNFGAYGIFIIHIVLLGLAIYAIAHLADAALSWKRWYYYSAIAALILGPISFWIYDHPVYGFNPDLLYLPFSLLLVVSLLKNSKIAWFWATLMVLLKQDGAVLCCSIYMLLEVLQPLTPIKESWQKKYTNKIVKLACIALFWLIIFILGMLVMSLMQYDPAESRLLTLLREIMNNYMKQDDFFVILSTGFRNLFWLSLGGFIFYLIGLPLHALMYTMICSSPLIVVDSISSFLYGLEVFPDNFVWESRFVKLWSLIVSGIIISIFQLKEPKKYIKDPKKQILIPIVIGIICFGIQSYTLLDVKNYNWFEDRFIYSLIDRRSGDITDTQTHYFLDCLSEKIPQETPILTNTFLFAKFHKHDLIWPGYINLAWNYPKVLICSEDRLQTDDRKTCFQDRLQTNKIDSKYRSGTYYNLHYSYLTEFDEAFKTCRDRTAIRFNLRQDAHNF